MTLEKMSYTRGEYAGNFKFNEGSSETTCVAPFNKERMKI